MSPAIKWFEHINYLTHGLRAMMVKNLDQMTFKGPEPGMSEPGSSVVDLYNARESLGVSMAYLWGSFVILYLLSLGIASGARSEWPALPHLGKKDQQPEQPASAYASGSQPEVESKHQGLKRAILRGTRFRRQPTDEDLTPTHELDSFAEVYKPKNI